MKRFLGANLETIGKAKLYAMALNRFLGVMPSLDIQDKYVRVFYPPDKLARAQAGFKVAMEQPPGKVRGDIAPIVTPYFVKKYAPAIAGSLVLGFIAGKALNV